MNITPEIINELIKQIGPVNLYEPSEAVTPKHIMYGEFVKQTGHKHIPKLVYYIIMDQVFLASTGKADSGELGYKLQLKTIQHEMDKSQ